MDRIDKHRELIMAVQIMNVRIFRGATAVGYGFIRPWEIRPRNVRIMGHPDVNMNVEMSANITLGEFRGTKDESIIPTLNDLLRFTRDSIESFLEEFV